MSRPLLDDSRIHPAVRAQVGDPRRSLVDEVEAAVAANPVVVVGMRLNPYPRKARALLEQAGIAHAYLEYGGYLSDWRRRNTLKMWSGWSTFPMVFVRGTLVGGYEDLKRLHDSGELARLLA